MPTAAPSQEKMLLQSYKSSCPLPGFVEIAQSLWGEGSIISHPSLAVIGIPPKEAEDQDPFEVMGSSMMTFHLFRYPTSGKMYIDPLNMHDEHCGLGAQSHNRGPPDPQSKGDVRLGLITYFTPMHLAAVHPPVVLYSFTIQHVCHDFIVVQ